MPTVFVPNLSHHDFSNASRYGTLVFLTEGWVDTKKVNVIFRKCWMKMQNCQPDDMLLVSGLPIINSTAAAIMAVKHKRINFLIFQRGDYFVVPIVVDPSSAVDQNLINGTQLNDDQ